MTPLKSTRANRVQYFGCVVFAAIFAVSSSQFDSVNDFQGWNCGAVATCGKFGQICTGDNIRGMSKDLTKTFNLPAGTYSVELDFIKIDSWCVIDI